MMTDLTIRIRRHKPATGATPYWESFQIRLAESARVLDALEHIRLNCDLTLMYRRSCHHASCGTCAILVNGVAGLACGTAIADAEGPLITLEPLSGFPVVGDLAVARDDLFEPLDGDWDYLQSVSPTGSAGSPEGRDRFERFENCIECGCCVAACPASQAGSPFLGPVALAAVNRQVAKGIGDRTQLLRLAGGRRGETWCERSLACSRVCPGAVYPARHIQDLRRLLKKSDTKK